ncbi:uncharacterized protein LOC117910176 isoform X2 [Vitis riparia]|uniref:uncharacterized protein LOC117910176 isoform X2 n=1 Tax=Vitis riparia TaxID=96939 RepID=UPI00155A353D|nr:uncharacterized protein LOC117910176 isoform X2 [Vitis riparia]
MASYDSGERKKRRKRCADKNLKLLHKMKMKSLLYIGVPSVESKSIGFGFSASCCALCPVEEPSECIVVEVLSSLFVSLGNCFFLPEHCSLLKNPVTVSLLEYFLHPLGPLVLECSFPIEESSDGFFVRESTAKSGLIERMMECGLLQPSHCSCTLCRSLELPCPIGKIHKGAFSTWIKAVLKH